MIDNNIPSSNDALPLNLKPIISYPREAEIGQRYVMTIDVQLATPDHAWQYTEEEYPITFLLNSYPYFEAQPLPPKNPTLVLHRLGGTYGPVEYLLTAADHAIPSGNISLTFLNASGIPITRMELTCCIKNETQEQMRQREIRLMAEQAAMLAATHTNPTPNTTEAETSAPIDTIEPDETHYPRLEEDLLREQLRLTGWNVLQTATEDEINTGNIAFRFYDPENSEQYLLFLQGELVAIVYIEPLGTLLTGHEEEIFMNETLSLLSKVENLHTLKSSPRLIIPFVYNATGAETYFTNYLEPEPRSRRIFTFHRPETLALWLTQSPPSVPTTQNNLFRSRVRTMPSLKEDGLFAHQVEAIQNLELSLAANNPRTLLQMNTGQGQTFTIMTSIYRLLEYGNASKILLLFDNSNNLNYMLESLNTYFLPEYLCYFSDRYLVWHLENDQFLSDSIIYLMTTGDFDLLLSPPLVGENTVPFPQLAHYRSDLPCEFFDVIFIRNQNPDAYHFLRNFLEYFDTFLIGIEKQPSSSALDFYQHNLVFQQDGTKAISVATIALQSFKQYYSIFREDELSYLDYIEQLSLLLFVKIASERDNLLGDIITENFWQDLSSSSDSTLFSNCQTLLRRFSQQTALPTINPLSSPCKISDPRKLRIIINLIDYLGRLFLRSRDLAHLYDELLTEIATEANSALSHHHTSPTLTQTIVEVMRPQPGTNICDPACGTGGFLISTQQYITKKSSIKLKEMRVVRRAEITGWEINESIARISAINLLLHEMGHAEQSPVILGTTIPQVSSARFDMLFCNLLFVQDYTGAINPIDLWSAADHPLLTVVQHIVTLLKVGGKVAIIVPDSLLFDPGPTRIIREQLLRSYELHTLLRLPSGILPDNIKGNVLFFDNPASGSRPRTPALWIYDYRTNQTFNPSTHPLTFAHLEDFVRCYHPENRSLRQETERFRRFPYTQLANRSFNLDITW